MPYEVSGSSLHNLYSQNYHCDFCRMQRYRIQAKEHMDIEREFFKAGPLRPFRRLQKKGAKRLIQEGMRFTYKVQVIRRFKEVCVVLGNLLLQ
jgi:hypothetical protein